MSVIMGTSSEAGGTEVGPGGSWQGGSGRVSGVWGGAGQRGGEGAGRLGEARELGRGARREKRWEGGGPRKSQGSGGRASSDEVRTLRERRHLSLSWGGDSQSGSPCQTSTSPSDPLSEGP